MVKLYINNIRVEAERGDNLLEVIRFYGMEVPTLCYFEGLSPYGACRLCLVELGNGKLVTSCTYPVEEGLNVRTNSEKVIRTRKMIIELLLATCPSSKTIQDLASKYGIKKVRFKIENENCILCGLCVRMCKEEMMAKAIGFLYRGEKRKISTPFNMMSEECRRCGACMYICPVCQLRCSWGDERAVCGSCANLQPPCLEKFDDMMCFMDPCVACELSGIPQKKGGLR